MAQRVWPMPYDPAIGLIANDLFQIAQFAFGAADFQLVAVRRKRRRPPSHSRGIPGGADRPR